MACGALSKDACVYAAATTDQHVGHSLNPCKEAQGTEDDFLTAALTVISGTGRRVVAGPALWQPMPCTSHSIYIGLFSFIAEQLLCMGNMAALTHRPGAGKNSAC